MARVLIGEHLELDCVRSQLNGGGCTVFSLNCEHHRHALCVSCVLLSVLCALDALCTTGFVLCLYVCA